jgi:hypothetical protein
MPLNIILPDNTKFEPTKEIAMATDQEETGTLDRQIASEEARSPLDCAIRDRSACELSIKLHTEQLAEAKARLKEANRAIAKLLGIRTRAKDGGK